MTLTGEFIVLKNKKISQEKKPSSSLNKVLNKKLKEKDVKQDEDLIEAFRSSSQYQEIKSNFEKKNMSSLELKNYKEQEDLLIQIQY